ncbi:MAG: 3-isopropylmalate dehydratase small subunit [Chloroflexota bacterium]
MEPITAMTSTLITLPIDNIDTDQIIPARFLKTTKKTGLGKNLFADWRYLPDGDENPDFALNKPEVAGAGVLIAGDNFGCGSSREHAPWSLMDYGFRAIVSTSFADIFRNNALKNGLLPIVVDSDTLQQLHSLAAEDPTTTVTVDLAQQQLILPDGRAVEFPIDGFSKTCLLEGIDQLGYLAKQDPDIVAYEEARPGRVNSKLHPLS